MTKWWFKQRPFVQVALMYVVFWFFMMPLVDAVIIGSIWTPVESRWGWSLPYYVMIMGVTTIVSFPPIWGISVMMRRSFQTYGDGIPTKVLVEETNDE